MKNLSMVSQMSLSAFAPFRVKRVAPFQEERKRSNSSCSLLENCLELCMIEQLGIFEGILSPFEIESKKKSFHMNLANSGEPAFNPFLQGVPPATYKWSFGAPTTLAENSRVTVVISSCF